MNIHKISPLKNNQKYIQKTNTKNVSVCVKNSPLNGLSALSSLNRGLLNFSGTYSSDGSRFTPAKTLEEAKRFASINFETDLRLSDLDCANYVNEALFTYFDMYHGATIMPSAVVDNSDEDIFAAIEFPMEYLHVNEKYITSLKNRDFSDLLTLYEFDSLYKPHESCCELLEKLQRREKLTLKDLIALCNLDFERSVNNYSYANIIYNDREKILKAQKQGVRFPKSIDEFVELDNIVQEEIIREYYLANGLEFVTKTTLKPKNEFGQIFHEIGHLHHFYSISPKYDFDDFSSGYQIVHSKKEKLSPKIDLTDDERNIAIEVSHYAVSSPAEFIAETFSQILNGKKFSDDVMKLYKKYCGPRIPKNIK